MKKNLLMMGFVALLAVPAYAELTVDDTVSELYLRNHGYSKASIYAIQRNIADVNGEEWEKPVESELYQTPVIKYARRFFMYIDPALEDDKFYNHHNIETTTKWTDL